MSTDDNLKPIIDFYRKRLHQLFSKIIRGDYVYERDLTIIDNYLQKTSKFNDLLLTAQIINTKAVLNSIAGYTQNAFDLYWDSHALMVQIGNPEYIANSFNNIGWNHMILGQYDEANTYYQQGIDLLNNDTNYNVYRLLLSNKTELALLQEDYETLDRLLAKSKTIMNQITRSNKEDYAYHMSGIYRVIAERELVQDDLQQARNHANLARELAIGLSLKIELARIHFTDAHIVLKESGKLAIAEDHWQMGLDILQAIEAPASIGQTLLEEARYLAKQGYSESSVRFAQQALSVFEAGNLVSMAALAQALIPDADDS